MSKKLFLKVGLLLLSLSFVSCGNDSNSLGEDTSSNASTSQAVINAEISEEESTINTSPSVETAVESELEDENVKQSLTEEEYYLLIKEAWQLQKDILILLMILKLNNQYKLHILLLLQNHHSYI